MYRYLIIIIVVFVISCNNITPSGDFWKGFRASEIYDVNLDHGPFGGTTEIKWKKRNNKNFTQGEIEQFAFKNGWKFIDQITISEEPGSDFSHHIIENRFGVDYLRNKTILRFESKTLTIREDEELSTEKNCFAILNKKTDSLTVYYRWGDF